MILAETIIVLCAFPLVGLVIGLCCRGWQGFSGFLSLPAVLRGAGLCLIPVLMTGGIHLDGYADTCDALASHAGREKRQQILKDPHLGAFAAIRRAGLPEALPKPPTGCGCIGF